MSSIQNWPQKGTIIFFLNIKLPIIIKFSKNIYLIKLIQHYLLLVNGNQLIKF
jgi:hypothetical protein